MDKDKRMFKTILAPLAFAMALGLIGCQGENTFRRESNPVKGYDSVLKDSRTYDQQREQDELAAKAKRDNAKVAPCAVPFTLSIEDETTKAVAFKVGQEKSILIHVATTLAKGMPWDVKLISSPCPNCFENVSKDDTTATYSYTWTPTANDATSVDGNALLLRYAWTPEARCASLPITDTITLDVKRGDSGPLVSFPGLSTAPIKYGDKALAFKVQLVDTGTTSVPLKSWSVAATAAPKQDGVLDASGAVDCKSVGQVFTSPDGKTQSLIFDCSLENKQIPSQADMKTLSGSGKTVDATFTIQAASPKSKMTSTATARVSLQFEKIASPKAVQGESK